MSMKKFFLAILQQKVGKSVQRCDRTSHARKSAARTSHANEFRTHIAHVRFFWQLTVCYLLVSILSNNALHILLKIVFNRNNFLYSKQQKIMTDLSFCRDSLIINGTFFLQRRKSPTKNCYLSCQCAISPPCIFRHLNVRFYVA